MAKEPASPHASILAADLFRIEQQTDGIVLVNCTDSGLSEFPVTADASAAEAEHDAAADELPSTSNLTTDGQWVANSSHQRLLLGTWIFVDNEDRRRMLLSDQQAAAQAVCDLYAQCLTWKIDHEDNVNKILSPIMQNYARRLLFSVGKTMDESVDEVIQELLLEYQTCISLLKSHSSNVSTSLQPLVEALPKRLLEQSWLGVPLASARATSVNMLSDVLNEYMEVCSVAKCQVAASGSHAVVNPALTLLSELMEGAAGSIMEAYTRRQHSLIPQATTQRIGSESRELWHPIRIVYHMC